MNGQNGFTLIEVLVATSLIFIVLLPLAAICFVAQGHLSRGGEQTVATALAQQRMEFLRNQGFAAPDLTAGTTLETLGGTYAGYARTTIVQDDVPRAGVKQLTVTTTAPSGLSLEIVSLITEAP